MDTNTTQLATVDSGALVTGLDLNAVAVTMQKINRFQSVIQTALQPSKDYGVIPGTGTKPTLLKPGAEKINMLFGLFPNYEFMRSESDFDKGFFNYEIRCTLMKGTTPVAQGVGSCNSNEKKYRYVTKTKEQLAELGVTPEQCTEFTDRYGRTKYRVEDPDIADKANTVLKMAKKRAYVDATLQVASLSDLFTQDLEDMDHQAQEESDATMTVKEAAALKLSFGKHKGRALGELYKDKEADGKGYLTWLRDQDRTDPVIRKAIDLLFGAVAEANRKPSAFERSTTPDANTPPAVEAEYRIPEDVPFTEILDEDLPPFMRDAPAEETK